MADIVGSNSPQLILSKRHPYVGIPFDQRVADTLAITSKRFMHNGAEMLGVVHTPYAHILLNNLGYTVPEPIRLCYDWGVRTPYAVQRDTAAMLSVSHRAYVLNEFGTGKTSSALWAADYLMSTHEIKKALVIAPLSTLRTTWAREVFRVVPHRTTAVLHGTREKRLRALAKDADIYIINHDGIKTIGKELIERDDIDLIIVDELAAFRDGGSDRSKMLGKILGDQTRWAWGMTGAPTPNGPEDAWSQARLITPWTVPPRMKIWRDKTMIRVSQFKWVPKPTANDMVADALSPSVRYTLDDVTELPELVTQTVEMDQSPRQHQIYEELRKYARSQQGNNEVVAVNEAVLVSKLLQISCGAVYSNNRGIVSLDPQPRLDKLREVIEQTENKVIVFVPFRHAINLISSDLTRNSIDHTIIHGDVPISQREAIFHEFQSNPFGPRVMVAHPQCMAHGLTLTAADTTVWYTATYDLEIFDQANARMRRIGQQHKQRLLLFCGTKAEQVAYKRLFAKQKMQGALLDMLETETPD